MRCVVGAGWKCRFCADGVGVGGGGKRSQKHTDEFAGTDGVVVAESSDGSTHKRKDFVMLRNLNNRYFSRAHAYVCMHRRENGVGDADRFWPLTTSLQPLSTFTTASSHTNAYHVHLPL